jgi:hypothetical protein
MWQVAGMIWPSIKLGGRVRGLLHLIHVCTTSDSGIEIERGCCVGVHWSCFGSYVDENLRATVSGRCIMSGPNQSRRQVLGVRSRDCVEITKYPKASSSWRRHCNSSQASSWLRGCFRQPLSATAPCLQLIGARHPPNLSVGPILRALALPVEIISGFHSMDIGRRKVHRTSRASSFITKKISIESTNPNCDATFISISEYAKRTIMIRQKSIRHKSTCQAQVLRRLAEIQPQRLACLTRPFHRGLELAPSYRGLHS